MNGMDIGLEPDCITFVSEFGRIFIHLAMCYQTSPNKDLAVWQRLVSVDKIHAAIVCNLKQNNPLYYHKIDITDSPFELLSVYDSASYVKMNTSINLIRKLSSRYTLISCKSLFHCQFLAHIIMTTKFSKFENNKDVTEKTSAKILNTT